MDLFVEQIRQEYCFLLYWRLLLTAEESRKQVLQQFHLKLLVTFLQYSDAILVLHKEIYLLQSTCSSVGTFQGERGSAWDLQDCGNSCIPDKLCYTNTNSSSAVWSDNVVSCALVKLRQILTLSPSNTKSEHKMFRFLWYIACVTVKR